MLQILTFTVNPQNPLGAFISDDAVIVKYSDDAFTIGSQLQTVGALLGDRIISCGGAEVTMKADLKLAIEEDEDETTELVCVRTEKPRAGVVVGFERKTRLLLVDFMDGVLSKGVEPKKVGLCLLSEPCGR